MFQFRFVAMGVCPLVLVLLSAGSMHATPRPLSSAEVMQKAVARAQQAQAASGQHAFTYTKVSVTEELDSTGKVREHKQKTYQIFFQSGTTHVKLLEVNGHAPTAADLKKQSDNEMSVHQLLGQPKSASGDNRDYFLTPDLVARYDFKLLDTDTVNGRAAYRVTFQPKNPELPEHRLVDRLLDRISGTLWIDAEEFEVARAEVRLGSEVDFLGGVVGCLKKLAYTITRTRVADGVWLNTISTGDFEGRKLLESLRIKVKSESTNFRSLANG